MLTLQHIKQQLLPVELTASIEPLLKCAAVLMPIVLNSEQQWEVILTKRAQHLKHHPGQISFPGGSFETNDIHLCETALRETHEEIGISAAQIELIGQLPQHQTSSQFNITPFVGHINSNYQIKIDYNEVAEVFTVPLEYLTTPTNYQKAYETYQGKQYHYYVIQYKHYNIWGATAKILINFSRRVNRNMNNSSTSLLSNH